MNIFVLAICAAVFSGAAIGWLVAGLYFSQCLWGSPLPVRVWGVHFPALLSKCLLETCIPVYPLSTGDTVGLFPGFGSYE